MAESIVCVRANRSGDGEYNSKSTAGLRTRNVQPYHQLWFQRLECDQVMIILTHQGIRFGSLAYHPSGRYLAAAERHGYGHCWLWDLFDDMPPLAFRVDGDCKGLAFSSDGRCILSSSRLCETESLFEDLAARSKAIDSLQAEPTAALSPLPSLALENPTKYNLQDLVLSPDGTLLAGRVFAPTLVVWNRAGKVLRTISTGALHHVTPRAFSPDSRWLAVSFEKLLVLLDRDAKSVGDGFVHSEGVLSAVFTNEGRQVATSAGRTVRIWDLSSGACVQRFKSFRCMASAVALHPSGRWLMAGADGPIRIWDVAALTEVAQLNWKLGDVYHVAFNPDGLTAAAACEQGIVIWDLDL
jgi:WD40 repeat protein